MRDEQRKDDYDVVLISMPFGPLDTPAIGLSLLAAALPDVRAKILYFTIAFAEHIGDVDVYRWIANGNPSTTSLLGEWLFRDALYETSTSADGYFENVLRPEAATVPLDARREDTLLAIRGRTESFLDQCVEEALRHRPRVVGFTSVFQQHVASLALARRLSQSASKPRIVFGGANCEGVMGLEALRQFPWIDAVVSGEGERIFPELVSRWLGGREDTADLEGLLTQADVALPHEKIGEVANAPMALDMDSLPVPDFEDFFDRRRRSPLCEEIRPALVFETSRGCWWGEKQHCTFCGLNGSGMAFRSKSPDRALDELLNLVGRYPDRPVMVVDNILDMRYFKSFLPNLAEHGLDLDLFYEVKANLRKDQLHILRNAGVRRIQPGIESLSDDVLKRMGKGTRALMNIRLLKWCEEVGIQPAWNLIWGFPGESPEEYERMASWIPMLTHLRPPDLSLPIRLDRFSPNFERGSELGFREIVPTRAYSYLYPVEVEALHRLAYYFDYSYQKPQNVREYSRELAAQTELWREVHAESRLMLIDQGEALQIWDLRPGARRRVTLLSGLGRRIYLDCDEIASLSELKKRAGDELDGILDPLLSAGLLLRDGDRFLSLATRVSTEFRADAQ